MPSDSNASKTSHIENRVYKTYSSATRTLSTASYPTVLSTALTIASRSRSWVRTANFKTLKMANQRLPDNSFTYDEFRLYGGRSTIVGPIVTSANGNWTQTEYHIDGRPGVGVVVPTQVPNYSSINAKLIEKAKGNQWNVPIFFAEGRKTAGMVAQAATQLVLMSRALKRGRIDEFIDLVHDSATYKVKRSRVVKSFNKSYAQDPSKTAANYWLQLRYGWLPFMGDVHSAMETLFDTADRPDSLDGTVKAKHSLEAQTALLQNAKLYVTNNADMEIWGNRVTLSKDEYRATWRYRVNPLDIPGRFGLLNPFEVAWELVPYSFVADWFLPIGSYFSSLDAPLRFSHLGGTYGYRFSTMAQYFPKRSTPAGSYFTGFEGQGDYVKIARSVMTSIPSVRLLALPMKFDLNGKQLTSALALIRQSFK